MIVYNSEPLGYSTKARSLWEEKGFTYHEGSWSEVDQKDTFPAVKVLIVRLHRKVTSEVLDKFPDLQYLVSATTGHDHIDLDALQQREIKLISLRGQDDFLKTIPSTAEHTWALLMALIRNIPSAVADVHKGNWDRDKFRGYQLKDKVLGIVGYGRTGKRVAQYARAFGMRVIYYDPYIDEGGARDEKVSDLDELLTTADIITLHVHLNDETDRLINPDKIALLKEGSFLINTSRGKIIDEGSAYNALSTGKLAGIATDVLATELEDPVKSKLWKAQQEGKNIIITPHLGGATWDAMWVCEEYIVQITNL